MKSNSKPLISIIVPVYNGEKYLQECADSILNQDYKNIELIVIDDGSKDKSYEIATKIAENDKRVRVFHQENSGVSTARNLGILKAKGEFLTFVDVDDYISKSFISYFYNMISENKAEIALTPVPRKFNHLTKNLEEETVKNEVIEIWTGKQAAKAMLYYKIAIGPWNKLISKKLIDKYNLKFNPTLSFGEGFNFSVDCFQRAKKVAVGSQKLYNYRVDNPNSVMTKFSLKLVTGSIEAQEKIKENLVDKSSELLQACKYANWHTHCDCLNTMIGCKVSKKHKDLFKKIKKVCRKDALCVLKAPISSKEKMKGLCYFISPCMAAKIINKLRIRKFTINESYQ